MILFIISLSIPSIRLWLTCNCLRMSMNRLDMGSLYFLNIPFPLSRLTEPAYKLVLVLPNSCEVVLQLMIFRVDRKRHLNVFISDIVAWELEP